jgi:hypothetical protein
VLECAGQQTEGFLTGETREANRMKFFPEPRWLNRESEYDALHSLHRLAALEIAPYFSVAVGEASEAFALHYREILDRGVRFFVFAYGKVTHGLDRGRCFRRLLLLDFNLHKF